MCSQKKINTKTLITGRKRQWREFEADHDSNEGYETCNMAKKVKYNSANDLDSLDNTNARLIMENRIRNNIFDNDVIDFGLYKSTLNSVLESKLIIDFQVPLEIASIISYQATGKVVSCSFCNKGEYFVLRKTKNSPEYNEIIFTNDCIQDLIFNIQHDTSQSQSSFIVNNDDKSLDQLITSVKKQFKHCKHQNRSRSCAINNNRRDCYETYMCHKCYDDDKYFYIQKYSHMCDECGRRTIGKPAIRLTKGATCNHIEGMDDDRNFYCKECTIFCGNKRCTNAVCQCEFCRENDWEYLKCAGCEAICCQQCMNTSCCDFCHISYCNVCIGMGDIHRIVKDRVCAGCDVDFGRNFGLFDTKKDYYDPNGYMHVTDDNMHGSDVNDCETVDNNENNSDSNALECKLTVYEDIMKTIWKEKSSQEQSDGSYADSDGSFAQHSQENLDTTDYCDKLSDLDEYTAS